MTSQETSHDEAPRLPKVFLIYLRYSRLWNHLLAALDAHPILLDHCDIEINLGVVQLQVLYPCPVVFVEVEDTEK